MARPIKTSSKVTIGIRITNCYTTGTETFVDLFPGDMVENLQYVENQEVVTVTGKITDISLSLIKGVSTIYRDITDLIKDRILVTNVTVDYSKEYESRIAKIPAKEILEYKAENPDEICRVKVEPVMKVDLAVTLSNGMITKATLMEGGTLTDSIVMTPEGDKAMDLDIKSFIYTITPKTMGITVSGITLAKGTNSRLDILAIKSCGKAAMFVSDGNLQETLDKLKDGSVDQVITLDSNTYNEKLTISSVATIKGYYANQSAVSGDRRSNTIDANETVLIEALSCEEGADVTVQGVTLTDKSIIDVTGAKSVGFKNCKFVATNPNAPKSFLLKGDGDFVTNKRVTKLTLEGCYFGDNNTDGVNKFYNGLECNFALAKGSYIKDCYFSKRSVSHNVINIYDVEDGATINITGNHFEMSANAIRIGTVGDVKATINIADNTYDETDSDPAYAGLVLFQPYGSKTVSMANLTVNIENTTKPEGQLWYAYMNPKDTQMNSTLWPTLYVDGKKETITLGDENQAE